MILIGVLLIQSAFYSENIADEYRDSAETYHNCRMWAAISRDMPDRIIADHLINYPQSLEHLSEEYNIDGWGIAYYPRMGDSAIIERGALRAHNDPYYDTVVNRLEMTKPEISLAHVRRCSAGCCSHGNDSIPDPHPFLRFKNGKYWTFVHNGTIDKALLYDLIGEQYLAENPPNGSDILECDPSDTAMIIDSELYFLLLLKTIEENNWQVIEGITETLVDLMLISYDEAMNFVLSDGYNIWSYCKDRTLYYFVGPNNTYNAVASMFPTENQGAWRKVNDYELLVINAEEDPIILDFTPYLPSISGTVTDIDLNPVSNATARIPGTDFWNRTNANGEYLIQCLSLGEYDISFTHPYYSDTLVQNIQVPPDSLIIIQDVIMLNPGTISGIVINPVSEAVENVQVVAKGSIVYDRTDINGEYILDSLDQRFYEVSFRHPYYSDTTISDIGVFSDSVTFLDIVIGYPGFITGVVTDEASEPLENIYVTVVHSFKNDYTDINGVFEFDSLNSGEYDILLHHINYQDTTIPDILASPGDTARLNIVLPFLGYAYIPGDINMHNQYWPPLIIGADVTYLVNFFRGETTAVSCLIDSLWVSADVNGDCFVTGNDITRMVNYFRGQISLGYCPEFPPRWHTPSELPDRPPQGWPPCEERHR